MTESSMDPRHVQNLEVASDLRNASDLLMQRLDRLYELEQLKRELPPDDPEFTRLAREVEDVARAALGASNLEVELADQVSAIAKRGDREIGEHPIREVPPGPRDAALILSEWRAAERALSAAAPGSDVERDARALTERLRLEYARTINLRQDTPGD
jgi:hypothetical protein